MTDHEHNEDHLLYGYVDYLDGEPPKVVILNRDDANEIVVALEAATNSKTWGEYRKNCPKVFLDRDMEDYLEYEDELPKDEEGEQMVADDDAGHRAREHHEKTTQPSDARFV